MAQQADPAAAPAALAAEPGQTSAFERARLAYTANDFETARSAALEAAEAGETQAMVLTALLMERGQGGPADETGARHWYEQAAAQNQPDALMALARMAADSRAGLAPADARDFLRRAQAQGAEGAGLALGRIGRSADALRQHPAGARAAFAAEEARGSAEAARELAMLTLAEGDSGAARAALERAAAAGDANAAYEAGILWADDAAAADGLAKAATLFRQAAEAGHPAGATLYAHTLYQGAGVAQDRQEAVRWYRAGAEAGDAEGAFYYAVMLFAGAGVPADGEAAYYWVLRSALAAPAAVAGYGERRDALRAQLEAALDQAARAPIVARAEADAAQPPG
jgi:TPR repeat protein